MAQLLRVDQYWRKVLKLKSVSGSQKFSVLGKVIKCALSLSHGNADNERSLSINKNTLSKESSLSITALNGLRAVEDGVRNEGGLRACAYLAFAFALALLFFDVYQYLPSLGVSSTIENSAG